MAPTSRFRLEPVVALLVGSGNPLSRATLNNPYFGIDQEGWIAVLRDEIDWVAVQERIEVPAGIYYQREYDLIFDEVEWVRVYGSDCRYSRRPRRA